LCREARLGSTHLSRESRAGNTGLP
jgi:hypothetical protein